MYTVTVESIVNRDGVVTMSLQDAINTYGGDELIEYLNGYTDDDLFFLSRDGEHVHPIPANLLEEV